MVAVTYEGFTTDLSVGNTVLVDDGLIGTPPPPHPPPPPPPPPPPHPLKYPPRLQPQYTRSAKQKTPNT
ncbi:hypothetical protein PV939_11715 [Ligilactobacillus salivarius]|nr:hypothetical protein [Ligilactobacillus salivarius]